MKTRLKRGEECNTYLTHVCRYLHSIERSGSRLKLYKQTNLSFGRGGEGSYIGADRIARSFYSWWKHSIILVFSIQTIYSWSFLEEVHFYPFKRHVAANYSYNSKFILKVFISLIIQERITCCFLKKIISADPLKKSIDLQTLDLEESTSTHCE